MSLSVFYFVLLIGTAYTFQSIIPCGPKPGPFEQNWRAILRHNNSLIMQNDNNNTRNLMYQIAKNPCLQAQYHGVTLDFASRLVLYGTCKYDRMFRFTARLHDGHCWLLEISLWDERTQLCETHEIDEDYLLEFPVLTEVSTAMKINLCVPDKGGCTGRAVPEDCSCNGTDGALPKMADLWRGRRCHHSQQQGQRQQQQLDISGWLTDPWKISGLLLLILGTALAGLGVLRWAAPPLGVWRKNLLKFIFREN